jgi:hypothetical protein
MHDCQNVRAIAIIAKDVAQRAVEMKHATFFSMKFAYSHNTGNGKRCTTVW